jgi:hypothetical protein
MLARVSRGRLAYLSYPVRCRPRFGHGSSCHPELYAIINRGRQRYADRLRQFLAYEREFAAISGDAPDAEPGDPYWRNGWLPSIDAMALYSFVAEGRAQRYVEIGSGNSTRFARRAIRERGCCTTITSIDPRPRVEVDALCDRVIRAPLEDVSLAEFESLEAGDIVFFDGSHVALMNSDVVVMFLEVLPRLRPGVLVQLHDIWLPRDYPDRWAYRYYSEQYLLACGLLSRGSVYEVVLPNRFIVDDGELPRILDPLWALPGLRGTESAGGSFWIRIAEP